MNSLEGQKHGHPYPIEVGKVALEILQVTVFYTAFVDIAMGEFATTPEGLRQIEHKFRAGKVSKEQYDDLWKLFAKYLPLTKSIPFQSVLISIASRWDWYIRNIADFADFARKHSPQPEVTVNLQKQLRRVDRLPVLEQLQIIEGALNFTIGLDEGSKEQLNEMSLTRNLGLHNNWQVDLTYMKHSRRKNLELGETRTFAIDELNSWHSILIRMVTAVSQRASFLYREVPTYEGTKAGYSFPALT